MPKNVRAFYMHVFYPIGHFCACLRETAVYAASRPWLDVQLRLSQNPCRIHGTCLFGRTLCTVRAHCARNWFNSYLVTYHTVT